MQGREFQLPGSLLLTRLCRVEAPRAQGTGMEKGSLLPRPHHPMHCASVSDTLRLTPSVIEVERHILREARYLIGSGTKRPSLGVKLGSVCPSIQILALTLSFKSPRMGTQTWRLGSLGRQEFRVKGGMAGLCIFSHTMLCKLVLNDFPLFDKGFLPVWGLNLSP